MGTEIVEHLRGEVADRFLHKRHSREDACVTDQIRNLDGRGAIQQ